MAGAARRRGERSPRPVSGKPTRVSGTRRYVRGRRGGRLETVFYRRPRERAATTGLSVPLDGGLYVRGQAGGRAPGGRTQLAEITAC